MQLAGRDVDESARLRRARRGRKSKWSLENGQESTIRFTLNFGIAALTGVAFRREARLLHLCGGDATTKLAQPRRLPLRATQRYVEKQSVPNMCTRKTYN